MPHDDDTPELSVVIPTMGRPILLKTVDSLLETELADRMELIVVGPIPEGPVLEAVEGYIGQGRPLRHLPIRFDTGDASRKRNAGFEASRADIIAFVDDDVYVPPHWPVRVLEAFSEPDVGMASGPSLVPSDISTLARLAGLALSSKAAGYVAERYTKGSAEPRRVKWSRNIGCNMIFRRDAFAGIGGFDPKFYPGEEMIAAAAVIRNGNALVFHPDAYVYHYPKTTFRGFWRQIFRYGATRVRLIRAGLDVELTPLVPAAWVASLVVLGVASVWLPIARWLLALDLLLYFLAAAWITFCVIRETRRPVDLWLLLIQPFMHLSYGVGIWTECFRPDKDLSDDLDKPTT